MNLVERQVDVFSDPSGPDEEPDYRQQQVFKGDQAFSVRIAGVAIGHIAVSQVLP